MSTFAASNKDGTCLWCGCKLRFRCTTTYEDTDKPPRRCHARHGLYGEAACAGTKFTQDANRGWVCTTCHAGGASGRRKIKNQTRDTDRPGPMGNGYFCSQYHAFRFAVTLAGLGHRLKPPKADRG